MQKTSLNSREIALTVEEPVRGLFHWVLLEACDVQTSDALHYRPWHRATEAQRSYSSALALGMAALRRVASGDDGAAANG
ncbi:hypothetical protein [Variovorax guangxiensis]|uniref:hypothetical protein n=1 Tax=Variovorax guangxiensis TaxID=1775474 RepID=UPI00112E9FA3|nr:hypothetical protein [Variovorax guangxiensis]